MAAGNNGASTPEDDDPFGYLYADGQPAGAQQGRQGGGYGYPGPAAQPGVPRTSYNQVRAVGERQYGQLPPQQPYASQPGQSGQPGQQPQQPYGPGAQQPPYGAPQQPYGAPNAQYAAPETYPGAPQHQAAPPYQERGGRSGGPNTRGLLIGAIAVVLVVVAGITVALVTNNTGKKDDKAGPGPSASAGEQQPSPSNEPSGGADDGGSGADKPVELPKQDAATLQLGAPAALAKDVKGAEGADGAYVTNFNSVGASVTWRAKVQRAGEYRLYVRYAIPAQDANATLTVNDKANSNPLGLKNFIGSSDPDLEKNWQTTWAPVTLQKGENTLKISCEQGNQCNAMFDWLEVRQP
ncbi:carbohydrate-binding protein [Streptomyces sp. LP05-1]|uniref:Carbohydrate-binding protein n=1 Tax=Streptomyces pyxinae TaxID=2970734 RepID=A0ABT2CF36_9ACTN|nr:CBM35 domain-containing protein [Streptomyces sp. LP05-1]MCS0636008.1 carbohydrate-binding protein [Streptomyces sp. LP05-1]